MINASPSTGSEGIAALIDGVTGNKPLPAHIRRDIVERTDGIPLFVEEMTKAVLEAESEGDAQQTAAAVPTSAQAVPASLHASLMARLTGSAPPRRWRRLGSDWARVFVCLDGCGGAQGRGRPSIGTRPSHCGRFAVSAGAPPHATYLFKHALVQDAAYGTLLREPRRALHASIVETLESQFSEIAENQPELLARHCTEARQIDKAASWWGKAGQRSLARSGYVEASTQLSRALTQIASLPGTAALRREPIKLQVALADALWQTKGYAA